MSKASFHERRRIERTARRKRINTIALIAGIAVLAVVAFFLFNKSNRLGNEEVNTVFPLSDNAMKTSSGLVYDDLNVGEGPEAKNGDTVSIVYTGYLSNGMVFESNVESGEYLEFVLGDGTIMPAWDEGIVGMKVGGARLLVVPRNLAYDTSTLGYAIAEDETLTFSITLKEIK